MSEEFKIENLKTETDENGIKYYKIPIGYKLFKATREVNEKNNRITLVNNKPYFFGEYNMDPDYIKSYEELYGIIYKFETEREYKLLALDDYNTIKYIYDNIPDNKPDIKKILRENYGCDEKNKNRNSIGENDAELSKYLCNLISKQGNKIYEGYATKTMTTDFGGTFHPEYMICDVTNIKCNGRITTDSNALVINNKYKEKQVGDELRMNRKKKYYTIYEKNENDETDETDETDENNPNNINCKNCLFF